MSQVSMFDLSIFDIVFLFMFVALIIWEPMLHIYCCKQIVSFVTICFFWLWLQTSSPFWICLYPWTPKPWKMKVLNPQYMGYNSKNEGNVGSHGSLYRFFVDCWWKYKFPSDPEAMVSWESLPLVPEEAPFLCIVMEHLGRQRKSGNSERLWLKWTDMWVFPKIGVPQNGWFILESPMNKWMIWGVPPFLETPMLVHPVFSLNVGCRQRWIWRDMWVGWFGFDFDDSLQMFDDVCILSVSLGFNMFRVTCCKPLHEKCRHPCCCKRHYLTHIDSYTYIQSKYVNLISGDAKPPKVTQS